MTTSHSLDAQAPGLAPAAEEGLRSLEAATALLYSAEIAQMVAIAQVAETYLLDEEQMSEQAADFIEGGAAGTPTVSAYVSLEISAMLGISPTAGAGRVAEVLNLKHRHRRLWDAVLAGRVRFYQAVTAIQHCRELSVEAADWVDQQLAIALAQMPPSRALRLAAKLAMQADPELAARKAQQEADQRYVGVGSIEDGATTLWGRLDASDGIALDQSLDLLADRMDPSLPRKQARAKALGILARSLFDRHAESHRQTPIRTAELIVRMDAKDAAVVELDQWGPALASQLGELLAGSQVTVRPIVFAGEIDPVDSYQIPERMRFAVCERNRVDAFPFGTLDSRRCDLDHTAAFNHALKLGRGQTRCSNLAPLSRRAHRAKTHAGWHLEQPRPGVLLWTSPAGYRYLVTPTGTVHLKSR